MLELFGQLKNEKSKSKIVPFVASCSYNFLVGVDLDLLYSAILNDC